MSQRRIMLHIDENQLASLRWAYNELAQEAHAHKGRALHMAVLNQLLELLEAGRVEREHTLETR